jgi:hypothetical protein
LDPNESDRYNELMNEDVQSSIIENIYKIMGHKKDYINPLVDGELSWRSVNFYDIDSDNSMERWQNKLYEVSTWRCVHITKGVRWIGFKLCDSLRFYGTGLIYVFLS